MPEAARAAGVTGGVWIARREVAARARTTSPAPATSTTRRSTSASSSTDRETGETKFLAFRNETGGQFIGEITDPYAVTWDGDRLALTPALTSVGPAGN